jgi:hypothetical protein
VYDAMEAEGFETALIWGQTAGTYERHADALYLANYYSNQCRSSTGSRHRNNGS